MEWDSLLKKNILFLYIVEIDYIQLVGKIMHKYITERVCIYVYKVLYKSLARKVYASVGYELKNLYT